VNEIDAREQADIEYFDGDDVVYLNTDDDRALHREPTDIRVVDDALHPSDRCSNCTWLVACLRCTKLVDEVQEHGLDCVDLSTNRGR